MLINLAAFVVVVAGIMSAKSLLIPFLLAAFLAIICSPPLYWLRSRGLPPALSILLLLMLVLVIETGIATLIGTSMADFSRSLPLYQERLHAMLKNLIAWVEAHGIKVTDQIIMDQFDPGKIMRIVANMLNNMFGLLTNTFMILLTFVFILLEAAGFPSKLMAIAGGSDSSMENYAKITKGVNRYLALKTLTSLTTGILAAAGLSIIGVDFAVMWGLLTFLLNFVPTIGSIFAAVPTVLLALVQLGPSPALATAALYLVINVIIGNIIEPRIMGSGVGLSALVIFVSMAFWGWVLGPVGMLLSVPLTMTIKIGLANNEKTRWIALLLGSNSEAEAALQRLRAERQEP
ncbi:MAG: AI-2E family transporter [Desulfobulbaceae bacterium]|nr:AI-2E family transporter [Desulfobulbaceae bacterium]